MAFHDQTIHMKFQALFSLKMKTKVKTPSVAVVISALRVNVNTKKRRFLFFDVI